MRKQVTTTLSTILLVGNIITGCTADMEHTSPREYVECRRIELPEATQEAAQKMTDFYYTFTEDMVAFAGSMSTADSGNVVVSPLSMTFLMAMLAGGAGETDRGEILDYLGISDYATLENLCETLLHELPLADRMATLHIANSLWVNSAFDIKIKDEYADVLFSKYGANTEYADFSNNRTVDHINSWCASKTGNMITRAKERLNPEACMLLVNAVYFMDIWMEGMFDASRTHTDTFHGADGECMVQMMESATYEGLYANDSGAELLSLPFGNGAFLLDVVVPSPDAASEGEGTLQKHVDTQGLRAKSTFRDISVSLPKFSIRGQYNISDMLNAVGMGRLNTLVLKMIEKGHAGTSIEYHQSTALAIDERGVEAAAESDGELEFTADIENEKPVHVTVDRPFWFFIREFSTGACILSGRIVNL